MRSLLRSDRRWWLLLPPLVLVWTAFVAVAFWRSTLVAPEPTLLVRDRVGRFVGELPDRSDPRDERLGFWPVEELPDRVVAATLAIEDRRFWWHSGVDPVAVLRAAKQNVTSDERVSGASTLAMQVARLQHPGARGYLRKALEAVTAWIATGRYGREGVLRHYLRIVPYGHRIHGIAFAARRYLDKPVEDLSWAEIAFLAAIPQSPSRMDPYDPAGRLRAIRRGRQILAPARRPRHDSGGRSGRGERRDRPPRPAVARANAPRPHCTRCCTTTRWCRRRSAGSTRSSLRLSISTCSVRWRGSPGARCATPPIAAPATPP